MLIVKYKKLHKNAVIPDFKHVGDAGKDLFATSIKYNPKYDRLEYGLGFATAIPKGFECPIRPRSTNTKKDWYIPNAPGTIDSNYRGEWFVMFKHRVPANILFPNLEGEELSKKMLEIAPYTLDEAVAQVLLKRVEDWKFEEVNELDDTERGTDGGLIRE